MKKAILLLSLMAATYTLSAQSVKFGIRGGLNLATVDRGMTLSGDGNYTKSIAAFNGGLFANIGFGNWAVEPGLFYTGKGYKSSTTYTSVTPGVPSTTNNITGTVKFNYLELPVNILYNVKLAPGKVFFGAGPYVGYLLSGNAKSVTTVNGEKSPEQKYTYNIGGDDNDLKRTDFGVNALAGFAFNSGFQISTGYGYGLTNIRQSDSKFKNRVFNVSVGFAF